MYIQINPKRIIIIFSKSPYTISTPYYNYTFNCKISGAVVTDSSGIYFCSSSAANTASTASSRVLYLPDEKLLSIAKLQY